MDTHDCITFQANAVGKNDVVVTICMIYTVSKKTTLMLHSHCVKNGNYSSPNLSKN